MPWRLWGAGLGSLLALWALSLFLGGCGKQDGGPPPQAVEANNRGVGLMGQFDYDGALEVFRELLGKYPHNQDFRINLAIATLNRQKEGDEDAALALLSEVLKEQPGNLRALYCSAVLRLHGGASEQASQLFRAVADTDPNDCFDSMFWNIK